jgi:SH3 domain protein
MKSLFSSIFFTVILLLLMISADVFAEAWYVNPSNQAPVRRGQGTDYKIVAMVKAGTSVTFLEESQGWTKIRLNNGKEGWILKRYLSNEKPLKDQVLELSQENILLTEKFTETDTRLTELIQIHSQTEQDLTACMAERDTIAASLQRLQQDTADVIQTKEKLITTETKLNKLTSRNADLQLENTALKKNSALIWFLAGSGVLLIGWFIGLIAGKRNKRHRSSLL